MPNKPITTYEELVKKRDVFNQYALSLSMMYEMLDELNIQDQSYLKEELGNYVDAIKTVRNYSSYSKNEVNNALETLSGFEDFLNKDIKGKTVYQRIVDDNELLYHYKFNSKENLDSYLKGVSDFLQLDLNFEKLNDPAKKVGIDPKYERREAITEKVESVEQFNKAVEQGKNFLDFGSTEYKYVDNFNKEIQNLIDKLNDKKEANKYEFERNTKEVELLEKLTDYHKAVKTLQEAPHKLPLNEQGIKESLQTLSDIGEFLSTYDDNGKTNYHYLTETAQKYNVNLRHLNTGIRNLDKTLNLSVDIGKISALKPKQVKVLTAAEYTKNIREYLRYNLTSAKKQAGYPGSLFSRMMAARMLANSVRGIGASLEVNVKNTDVDKKAEELLNHPTYKEFIETLEKDPKMLAKAESAAKTGHGGGLDDMFKEFLLNKPAGELTNDPLLERYMPKAVDRIEVLQNQAKNLVGEGKSPDKQIAEILIIRDLSNSIRYDKDSLDKPIPTNRSLVEEVDEIVKDETIQGFAKKNKIIDRIKDGHGGNLTEYIDASLQFKDKQPGKKLGSVLKANQYKGRLNNNCELATNLKNLFEKELNQKKPNQETLNRYCKYAKNLIAEQVAVYSIFEETNATDNMQVEWDKVDKVKNNLLKSKGFNAAVFGGGTPDALMNELNKMGKTVSQAKYVRGAVERAANAVDAQVLKNKVQKEGPKFDGPVKK